MASYLPEEIFSKILSRVTDLKALIRFKTVCKLWHSLISDSVFSDSVLADPHFLQPQEIIITTVPEPSSPTKPAWSLKTQGQEFKVNQFFPRLLSTFTVVSSCNGLLLILSGSHELCVCNPITDSYLALPSLRSHPLHSFDLFLFYDISIEKYKVLGLSSHGCVLLTLGDSCWQSKTDQFLVYMTGFSQLVYLWNQVHILKNGSLVSIDAATMEFSLHPIRQHGSPPVGEATTLLSVVRGSLCLTNVCQGIIDIFVLENRADTIWKNYTTFELRYLSCMRDVNESWLRDRDFSISLFVMGNADTCDYSDMNFLIHCRFNRR